MKRSALFLAFFLSKCLVFAQSGPFETRGTGGGGATFCPSINPSDGQEFYIASDLAGLYRTKNGGLFYDVEPFWSARADVYSRVVFCENPARRFGLFWDRAAYSRRPARSDDGGTTWSWLAGEADPSEEKLFLFADRTDGERIAWTDYNQLFYSNDGGATAKKVMTAADPGAGILLSGAFFDGQDIFFGTNEGVLRSSDGGQNFSLAPFSGIPSDEAIIGFGGARLGATLRFFALTASKSSVWAVSMQQGSWWATIRNVYSMDAANGIWQPKNTGINFSKQFVYWLGMAENDPSVCWLAGSDDLQRAVVLRTSDAGATWQNVFLRDQNENIFTAYAGHGGDFDWGWAGNALGFGVNPTDSKQAIVTDYGFLHQTKNGGADWHQIYADPADEHPKGQPTPKRQFYRGVGMEQTTVWQLFHFDQTRLFGCFTDIRGTRSEDGGRRWGFDYAGHAQNTMYRIAQQPGKTRWFGATSTIHDLYQSTYVTDARIFPNYSDGAVVWTEDFGETWQTMRDFGRPVVWLAADPTDSERLFVAVVDKNPANGGLWRADGISNPATAVWTKLEDPPTANEGRIFNVVALNDGTLVTTFSAKKSDSGSTFSAGSGVFVSTDGGQTWQDRSHPSMKFWTKDVVIDPSDASQNTWFACVWAGWGGPANDLGRLWRTTDRGQTWSAMTAPQQFHRVSSVTVDPKNAETMFLTTEEQGLWRTTNKSAAQPTWTLVEEYPFLHPERVFFSPFDPAEMWICSFGNGLRVSGQKVGIEKGASAALEFSVAPNPSDGFFEAKWAAEKGSTELRAELFDALGQVVFSKNLSRTCFGETSGGRLVFDLAGRADGLYFLVLKNEKGEAIGSKRLVKKR